MRGEAASLNVGRMAHWLRHNERPFVCLWKDNDGLLHPDICLRDKDGLIVGHSGSRSNVDKHYATRHPNHEHDKGGEMMMRRAFGIAAAELALLTCLEVGIPFHAADSSLFKALVWQSLHGNSPNRQRTLTRS
jgi:hypothetical protein